MYRKDRPKTDKKCGGGVFILVKSAFTSTEISLETNCELVFIELCLRGQENVKIGCMYRPPWADDAYMQDFSQVLDKININNKGNIWIGGDFNFPHTDWPNHQVLPGNTRPRETQMLFTAAEDHSLSQVVNMPTRKENILDLFFTSTPSLVNRVETIPPLMSSADHDIVFIDIDTRAVIPKQANRNCYLFNKANWEAMRQEVASYSLPDTTVQEQWDSLESHIKHQMEKYIPSRKARSHKQKPWVTRDLITLMHRRDRAYKKWKHTHSEDSKTKFQQLRSLAQCKLREAHRTYTDSIFNLEDPKDSDKQAANKRFWTYVKSKKKDSCSTAPLRKNGVLISDAVGKAQILNDQYCSVFTQEDFDSIPALGPSHHPRLPEIDVASDGVKHLLLNLNPSKAAGPDQISPRVLKELANELADPLSKVFQHSISSGTVPKQWREATVAPIFKKGDKHNAANYRPVSLTSICCKLCEHIIARSIMCHLEDNNILTDAQHGFRSKRSCETQLIELVDDLARNMCDGQQIDLAILDFSKAFDVVPHQRLLTKLHHYGIRGNIHRWIESFLNGRTQRVVVDGDKSDEAPVTSGVPQGSVLGPVLFLCFINDMPEVLKSDCRLFADDSIVYRKIATPSDCDILQADLEALEAWERTWGMSFNPSKCKIMHASRKRKPLIFEYKIKNETLEAVDTATYLGVEICKDLSWKNQVSKVTRKGNTTLGFLRRNIKTSSLHTKELAYKTLVRPLLEYSATVWDPYQKFLIHNIEMVQHRAVRFILQKYQRRASVTAMLAQLQLDSLEQRRLKAKVTMLFKIINGMVAIPPTQLIPRPTRTRGNTLKFIQLATRTNYYKQTFFPSTIPVWNSLPAGADTDNIMEFRALLSDLHLERPKF